MIDYEKYIERLLLNNFAIRSRKYNAECPLCDDNIVRKHRLWFLQKNDSYIAYCHNAGCLANSGMNIVKFIKLVDTSIYNDIIEEFRKEKFEELKNSGYNFNKRKNKQDNNKLLLNYDSNKFVFVNSLNSNIFIDVKENKKAYEYLMGRKIPIDFIIENKFKYCIEKYHAENMPYGNMITIPFIRKKDNKIYGFSSRSITDKKFHISLVDENNPKIYNIFNIDNNKPVYIFEGIFDSCYIDNSIALNGAVLNKELLSKINKPVFCLDNDQTGYNKMLEYMKSGYKCCILTKEVMYNKKDINELVIHKNYDSNDIKRLIISNTIEPNLNNILYLTNLIKKYRYIKISKSQYINNI